MIKTENGSTDIWSGKAHAKGKTIVIDGDWLAFVGACMTHVKHLVATDSTTGLELSAATSERALENLLTTLGRSLKESSITVTEEKRLISNWEATAKGVMIGKANKLKRECGADRILIAIGRKNKLQRSFGSTLFSV